MYIYIANTYILSYPHAHTSGHTRATSIKRKRRSQPDIILHQRGAEWNTEVAPQNVENAVIFSSEG